ncbi:MAG TPA: beta-ketoacyl-ACP synthase III [Pirellulales bacterium]|jgi:3-oxoacyl-[acyl-carrier-protein] synthase-3|nr:beta-ketoacyl-ACP synthase III [Pirellulales bacterium]
MADFVQPVLRSPVRKLTGVKILATGSYVPERVVRNEDLAELGYDADWILQRTGIRERRYAAPEQATSDLAIAAARKCLAAAGIKKEEIDLVVVGTFTGDQPTPSVACQTQEALGLNAGAFDVNAACAGFMYALLTGMQFVGSGGSRMALVVGADCNSRICNPADRKTFPLFGDGAGAVLLTQGESQQGLARYTLGADGTGGHLLMIAGGGTRRPLTPQSLANHEQFLTMDGRPVFKWAIRLVSDTIYDVLRAAELTIPEVDYFILHQANIRIIDAVAAELQIPAEKMLNNLDRFGNTSAGSIPLVLDEAVQAGKIRPGAKILFSGFGAGLSWGTGLFVW